jgi:hypothetical protein
MDQTMRVLTIAELLRLKGTLRIRGAYYRWPGRRG